MRYSSFTNQLLALPAEQRENIKNLLHSQLSAPASMRSNLDTLWEDFYDLADENFVSEFARKPNDRAWEMQLGVALRRAGLKLEGRKPGPDFLTSDGKNRVWIEAVVAEPGDAADAVPSAEFITLVNAPEDQIIFRITNALNYKMRQLKKHIAAGIVENGDRYVIALCASIPNHLVTSYHAIRAVYGIGGWQFDRDPETSEVIAGHLASKREVHKVSGAPVSTDAFLSPAWSRVSGLLFAAGPFATDLSLLGNGFTTLHNFSAQFPLRTGWLRFHSEYRIEEREGVQHLARSYGKPSVRLPSYEAVENL
jgi:hypothetical protein